MSEQRSKVKVPKKSLAGIALSGSSGAEKPKTVPPKIKETDTSNKTKSPSEPVTKPSAKGRPKQVSSSPEIPSKIIIKPSAKGRPKKISPEKSPESTPKVPTETVRKPSAKGRPKKISPFPEPKSPEVKVASPKAASLKVVSPKASPKVAPKASPKVAPKAAPKVAPIASPKAAPKVAPIASPKVDLSEEKRKSKKSLRTQIIQKIGDKEVLPPIESYIRNHETLFPYYMTLSTRRLIPRRHPDSASPMKKSWEKEEILYPKPKYMDPFHTYILKTILSTGIAIYLPTNLPPDWKTMSKEEAKKLKLVKVFVSSDFLEPYRPIFFGEDKYGVVVPESNVVFEFHPQTMKNIYEVLDEIGKDPDAFFERLGVLTSTCLICGRPLKADTSVARAMGPVCYKRMGTFAPDIRNKPVKFGLPEKLCVDGLLTCREAETLKEINQKIKDNPKPIFARKYGSGKYSIDGVEDKEFVQLLKEVIASGLFRIPEEKRTVDSYGSKETHYLIKPNILVGKEDVKVGVSEGGSPFSKLVVDDPNYLYMKIPENASNYTELMKQLHYYYRFNKNHIVPYYDYFYNSKFKTAYVKEILGDIRDQNPDLYLSVVPKDIFNEIHKYL